MGKSKEAGPSATTSSADRIRHLTMNYMATKSGSPASENAPSHKAQFDSHPPPPAPKKKAPSSSKADHSRKYDDLGIDMSLLPSATSTVKMSGSVKKPESGFSSRSEKSQESSHLHNVARRSFDALPMLYGERGPRSSEAPSKTKNNGGNHEWHGQPQTYEAPLNSRDRVNQLVRTVGKGVPSSPFLGRDSGGDARSINNDKSLSLSRGRAQSTDDNEEEGQNFCTRKPVIKELPADGPGYVKTSFRQPFRKAPQRPDPLSREYHRKYDDTTMLSNDLAQSWHLDDDSDVYDDLLEKHGPPVAGVDAYLWKNEDFVTRQREYQERGPSTGQDKRGSRAPENGKPAPLAQSQDAQSQTGSTQQNVDRKSTWEALPPRSFPLGDYDHDEAHHAMSKDRIEELPAFPLSRSNDDGPNSTWNAPPHETMLPGPVAAARPTVPLNNHSNTLPNNLSNESLPSNSQSHSPTPMTKQSWVICPYCHSGFGHPLPVRSDDSNSNSSNPGHGTSSNP